MISLRCCCFNPVTHGTRERQLGDVTKSIYSRSRLLSWRSNQQIAGNKNMAAIPLPTRSCDLDPGVSDRAQIRPDWRKNDDLCGV